MDRGYILLLGGAVTLDSSPRVPAGCLLPRGWEGVLSVEDLEKKTATRTGLNLRPSPSQKAFFSSWSRMAWMRWTASFRACRTVSCPPVSTESSTSSSLVSSSSRHR